MASYIRVISRAREPSFGERIDVRARAIVGDTSATWGSAPVSLIERELSLLLHRVDMHDGLHRQLERELAGSIFTVRCELDERMTGRLRYSVTFEDVAALRDRLWRLESERRQLLRWHDEQTAALHERMLLLLNRHALLGTVEHER